MGQRLGSNWQEMHKNHINPLHQYPNSLYSFLYIPFGADKENLFNNQSFLACVHFLYSHDLK